MAVAARALRARDTRASGCLCRAPRGATPGGGVAAANKDVAAGHVRGRARAPRDADAARVVVAASAASPATTTERGGDVGKRDEVGPHPTRPPTRPSPSLPTDPQDTCGPTINASPHIPTTFSLSSFLLSHDFSTTYQPPCPSPWLPSITKCTRSGCLVILGSQGDGQGITAGHSGAVCRRHDAGVSHAGHRNAVLATR